MLKLKLQYFGHLMRRVDSLEGLRAGGEGDAEDEMAGWYHQLNGHGFGWTLGVGDRQGGLAPGVLRLVHGITKVGHD